MLRRQSCVNPTPVRDAYIALDLGCEGAWAPTGATREQLISDDLTLGVSQAGPEVVYRSL